MMPRVCTSLSFTQALSHSLLLFLARIRCPPLAFSRSVYLSLSLARARALSLSLSRSPSLALSRRGAANRGGHAVGTRVQRNTNRRWQKRCSQGNGRARNVFFKGRGKDEEILFTGGGH